MGHFIVTCVTYSNMRIIFITAVLGLHSTAEAWSFFRNPKIQSDFLTLPRSGNRIIPRVPHRNRGLEHKDDGRSKDWTFDQKRLRPLGRFDPPNGGRSRQSGGRFNSEPIINGIPYGKSGYAGSATLYDIEITESGVSFLNVMTNGGQGDVDIYIKRDDYPTKRNYDIKSAYPGNQEQIILEAPVPGRYYIVLYGYENYNMVGFEAEYR